MSEKINFNWTNPTGSIEQAWQRNLTNYANSVEGMRARGWQEKERFITQPTQSGDMKPFKEKYFIDNNGNEHIVGDDSFTQSVNYNISHPKQDPYNNTLNWGMFTFGTGIANPSFAGFIPGTKGGNLLGSLAGGVVLDQSLNKGYQFLTGSKNHYTDDAFNYIGGNNISNPYLQTGARFAFDFINPINYIPISGSKIASKINNFTSQSINPTQNALIKLELGLPLSSNEQGLLMGGGPARYLNPKYNYNSRDPYALESYSHIQDLSPEQKQFIQELAELNNVDLTGINIDNYYITDRMNGGTGFSRELKNRESGIRSVGLVVPENTDESKRFGSFSYKLARLLPINPKGNTLLFKLGVTGKDGFKNAANARTVVSDMRSQLFSDGYLTMDNLKNIEDYDFTPADLLDYLSIVHGGAYVNKPQNLKIDGIISMGEYDKNGFFTRHLEFKPGVNQEEITNNWKMALPIFKKGNKLIKRNNGTV